MKWNRLVALLAICGLIAGLLIHVLLLTPENPANRSASAATAVFDRFPPGKTITVRLPEDVADTLSMESDEQLRDWLLYATVFSSGIDAKHLQATLYDLPPVRTDYLRPVSGYSYGAMRWRRLPDGRVAVLVSGNSVAQKAQLGRAADEAYCNSNTIAPAFLVFSYVLAPEKGTASLTRQPDVTGDRLFSEEYGYRTSSIDSFEALQKFLGSINRLTAIEVKDGKAIASGRADALRAAGLMRAEDVAALWVSQKSVDEVKAQQDATNQRIEAFNAKWKEKTYKTEEQKAELDRQYEVEKADLERELKAIPARKATASGFSLDPAYDFTKLTSLFEQMQPMLATIKKNGAINEVDITAAKDALEKKDAVPLLVLLDKASKSDDALASFVGGLARFATKDAQRQSARYDGLLQGTEVGMTLFYTDLLAKLWALDYHESSPTYAQVANFIPLLRTPVNAAYLPEVESLPGTRVWFGPDDNGFQKVSQPTTGVRFAARTTRIYAASSNPTEPGKESQPNAPSAQFLGWWHDHYEAVAAYEPQYQRLDEIMKWSVAISYLSGQSAIDSVDYLKNVHVGTGQWFPCWTAQHPELKFSNWKTIEFFDKRCSAAERDFPTETMPTLASKSYHGWTLSGGVSLASREGLLDRPAMSLNIPEELRRTGIDFSGSDGSLIRTLGKVEYSLGDATSDLATTTIKAPPAAHFRDVTSELRPAEVATRFERNGNVLSTLTKVGDAEVASVTFARRSDELVVALTRRDAARATELLADVNAEAVPENIAEWLSRRSDVATTIPIDERTALVRLNGADQWMKIVRETKPSIDIASDVVMRGGQVGTGATGDWTIAFVDRQTIDHVLDGGDFVLVRVANDPAQGVVIEEVAHGPPADAQTVTSGKISGKRSGNDIYVRRADLGGQADPAVLRRFAKQVDVDSALAYAQEGRYDKFAAEVAQNPEQYKREIANMAGSLDRGIDASLRNGDGRGALVLIARRTPYGGDPAKLAIRRAVAAAIVEKPGAAARALNDVALTPQLADESMTMAKAVLARDDLSDGARDSLERLATFIDYKRMAARSGTVVTATAESGGVDFLAEVRDLRVKRVATINPLAAGDAYVGADVPAAAIRHQTTAQGVDQIAYDPNVVEAFAVEDRALVLAHPAAIFDSKTGHRYQMAVRQAAVRTVPPNGRTYRTFVERCPPTAAGSPMPPDCRDPVYVLRPRQGMAVSVGP